MAGGSKTLLAALVTLVFAIGLSACGGSGDSGSTTSEAAPQEQSGGKAEGGGSPQGEAAGGGGEANQAGSSGGDGPGSFEPRQHEDSGGGSEQYQVEGGDNSVQEFGAEADASDREAAATALHNFLDARAAGEWEAACAYLASSVTKSLEVSVSGPQGRRTSCARGLEKLTNPDAKAELLAEAEQIDVGSLRYDGDLAFIIFTATGDVAYAMPMMLEDGSWKVAALAGGPLS